MKKLLLVALAAATLYAEATFEQVQSMIGSGQYKQAVLALTVIAENHPNSSKVQYTLAQAQAGLGNLPAANAALDKALALNPKLDFVPADQVKQLQQALQPQIKLIKPVPTGRPSTWECLLVVLSFGIVGFIVYRKFSDCPAPVQTTTRKHPGYGFTTREKGPETRTTYSRRPDDTSSPVMNQTSSYQPSYSRPNGRPSEVHHHYHDQSRGSDLGTTILASAATAAVVSSLMDDDSHSHRSDSTEPYRPSDVSSASYTFRSEDSLAFDRDKPISSSWNDSTPSRDTSWEDTPSTPSRSTSWDDSSSSSSSWSDSSSSSSSDSSSSS